MQRTTLAMALLALSATASAGEFDYNYFTVGYGQMELDEVDVDGDGFGLGGSFALSDSYHVFAGYENGSFDFDPDIDMTAWAAGIGWNAAISPTVDLVTRLSYQYMELEADGFGSVDDNGLGLGVGLRFAASQALELDAGIDYVDFGDGGETAFGVGGLYSFTKAFALGLAGDWGDDVSSYTISVRFYFGR
jgi:hypothetical protein